jgi:hypothetical protein
MLAKLTGWNEPEQIKHDHVHIQVDSALIAQLREGYAQLAERSAKACLPLPGGPVWRWQDHSRRRRLKIYLPALAIIPIRFLKFSVPEAIEPASESPPVAHELIMWQIDRENVFRFVCVDNPNRPQLPGVRL